MSDAGFASHTNLIPSGSHTFVAQHGDDKGLHAEFYIEPVLQEFASKGGDIITGVTQTGMLIKESIQGAGRPVYKDEIFIHIARPGDKSDLRRKARMETDGTIPTDPERFPRQWQQFQNKQEQTQGGTPLEVWPPLTKSQVLELKGVRVFTVEQLGMLPDSTLQNIGIMDIRRLRDLAKAHIENSDGASLSSALSTIEQLRIDNEAMKKQFAELAAEREATKRGPGRPRKDESNDD